MDENERIAKQIIAITNAAAQSQNPAYREAAERWKKRVERQLERDRKSKSAKAA